MGLATILWLKGNKEIFTLAKHTKYMRYMASSYEVFNVLQERLWLMTLAFTCIFGVMFVKAYHTYSIVQRGLNKHVSNSHLGKPYA